MSAHIDLNCDMGESFGAWKMGADAEVMPWVTSANIACGFHAGDPSTMRETVSAAHQAGIAIGAHIGLPDLVGFGRRAMSISAQQAYDLTVVQIGALMAVARTVGAALVHVKPHGALYHMAEQDQDLAGALARAIRDVDPTLRLTAFADGQLIATGQAMGLAVTHEVFADRRYQADGRLVPRSKPDAVIEDADAVAQQAVDLAVHGRVTTINGSTLELRADSICVHGDRDDAETVARTLHQHLRKAGVSLQSVNRPS